MIRTSVSRSRRAIVLAVSLAACCLASSVGVRAQEPISLRWKFEAGAAYVTDWTQGFESRVTIENAGGETLRRIDTKYDLSMRIAWTVESVDGDGTAATRQTIESLALAVRAPGNVLRRLELPGAGDPPTEFAALHEALSQAMGEPIGVTLSPRGEPISVELPDGWAKLAEDDSLGPAAKRLATPEGWKTMLASSATPLPDGPVAIGDSWTRKTKIVETLPYEVTTKWTLASVEANVATLLFESTVEKDAAGAGESSDGTAPERGDEASAGAAITGFERSGSATFDVERGLLESLETTTKLNLGKRSGEYVLRTQQSGEVSVATKPAASEPNPDPAPTATQDPPATSPNPIPDEE